MHVSICCLIILWVGFLLPTTLVSPPQAQTSCVAAGDTVSGEGLSEAREGPAHVALAKYVGNVVISASDEGNELCRMTQASADLIVTATRSARMQTVPGSRARSARF